MAQQDTQAAGSSQATSLPSGWVAIECEQVGAADATSVAAEKTFGDRVFRIRRTVKNGGHPLRRIFIDCLRVDRAFATEGGAA